MEMSETKADVILQQYNEDYRSDGLSAVVFLVIVAVIGFVGNSVVFYIYVTKMKATTIKCFILALTVIDWSICVIDIPLEITELHIRYTFGRHLELCKIFHVAHDFLFITSMFLLVAIAVERFRRVCQPLKKQMAIFAARVIIIVCCIVGFLLAIPAGFKYGQKTTLMKVRFANGTRCSVADDHDPVLVMSNYIFWIVLDVTTFGVLIILYSIIWCKIYWYLKNRKKMKAAEGKQLSNENSRRTSESAQTEQEHAKQETSGNTADVSFNLNPGKGNLDVSNNRWDRRPQEQTCRRSSVSTEVPVSRRKSSATSAGGNITTVMFLVAFVSFLAYMPIFIKMTIRVISEPELSNFKKRVSWLYFIFVRTYYIPCASNPLIYGFCNRMVRCELIKIVKRFRQ